TALGALSCFTGRRTGRSPADKFLVRDAATAEVAWGKVNQPMDPATFAKLAAKARAHLSARDLFVCDGAAGADPAYRVTLRVVSETAWHTLFARCLFLRPSPAELAGFRPDWTILHAPTVAFDPAVDGTNSDACIAA